MYLCWAVKPKVSIPVSLWNQVIEELLRRNNPFISDLHKVLSLTSSFTRPWLAFRLTSCKEFFWDFMLMLVSSVPLKSNICLHVGCFVSIWLWANTLRSTTIVSSSFQSVYMPILKDLCSKLDFGISSDCVPWPSLCATLVLLFNTWWRYVSLRCLVNMGQAAEPHFQ